jgi:hypothetical protein
MTVSINSILEIKESTVIVRVQVDKRIKKKVQGLMPMILLRISSDKQILRLASILALKQGVGKVIKINQILISLLHQAKSLMSSKLAIKTYLKGAKSLLLKSEIYPSFIEDKKIGLSCFIRFKIKNSIQQVNKLKSLH